MSRLILMKFGCPFCNKKEKSLSSDLYCLCIVKNIDKRYQKKYPSHSPTFHNPHYKNYYLKSYKSQAIKKIKHLEKLDKGQGNHKSITEKRCFYKSKEWLYVRYKALIRYKRKCMACGATYEQTRLHVDHIKPRSKYPELELKIDNLQILCEDCNYGKSNLDETDLRPKEA